MDGVQCVGQLASAGVSVAETRHQVLHGAVQGEVFRVWCLHEVQSGLVACADQHECGRPRPIRGLEVVVHGIQSHCTGHTCILHQRLPLHRSTQHSSSFSSLFCEQGAGCA